MSAPNHARQLTAKQILPKWLRLARIIRVELARCAGDSEVIGLLEQMKALNWQLAGVGDRRALAAAAKADGGRFEFIVFCPRKPYQQQAWTMRTAHRVIEQCWYADKPIENLASRSVLEDFRAAQVEVKS